MNVWILACRATLMREVLRLFRQRSRLLGYFLMPVIFWLLLGFGVGDRFQSESMLDYREWFLPGAVVMVVMFSAIFSTITVIEDRQSGFLQGMLASSAPRSAYVVGKCAGGALAATVQGILMVIIAPLFGVVLNWPLMTVALGSMFLIGMALTAVGLCMAWPMSSSGGYHALMNVVFMPMWFLSGAVFPLDGAPLALRVIMWINPLTYGHATLVHTMLCEPSLGISLWVALAGLLGFTVLACGLATFLVRRPSK